MDCPTCSAHIEVGSPATGDFVLCARCAGWARFQRDGRIGRWAPVTDEGWLTSPAVVTATEAGVDSDVPWFDPTDPRWHRWHHRWLGLGEGERAALLEAAADPDAPGWETRCARLKDGSLVWFSCGRPDWNLVVVDRVGLGSGVLRAVDERGLECGVPSGGVCLVPVDRRWEGLVCSGSWVVVVADGEGLFPWEGGVAPSGVVLWDVSWFPGCTQNHS